VNGRIATAAIVSVAASTANAQQPRYREHVEVARVVIDARAIDRHGAPIVGLTADDFAVRIDGTPCRIESATWVGDSGQIETPDVAVPDSAVDSPSSAPGRLVVFLFQKDLEPSRVVGLIRMLMKSRDFLGTLTPADRVAILSFDGTLRIWTDFTRDRQRLSRVLEHGVLHERPPPLESGAEPSLVSHMDPKRALHTYGIERALELVGEALEPLPGGKSVVLVGHGFGRLSREGVRMERDYEPARRALVAARASVFSLDVTDADYHSLEEGLQNVSEDTGGFYAQTHIFPAMAMRRLSGALAGYYVLFVEKPESRPRDEHDISVKLVHHKGEVLASSSYAERRD
jgi:VWFA-related protein